MPLLDELSGLDLDPTDLGGRDGEFIEAYGRPFCDWIAQHWFRIQHEGTEHIPRDRPFLAISIHSGGAMLTDVWPMLSVWWDVFGTDHPSYALVHDMAFRIPLLREYLIRLGALRASRATAEAVLEAGGNLLIFPGGDREVYRSWWKRNEVDLYGHTVFAELALTHGVPIVPVVNVGGAEVAFTALSSERLARWSGIERLTRVKTVPINVGLPWGVWPTGFVPYLPFPSRISYKVCPVIEVPRDPDAAKDPDAVRDLYDRTQQAMQTAVDDLASRRRFPIIG